MRAPTLQSPTRIDFSHDEAKQEANAIQEKIGNLQEALFAEGTRSLLVVLQGTDASGKDGLTHRLFRNCKPQGVHVTSYGVPEPHERAHDFLWRHHRDTPMKGHIGVWNRSHYGAVMVERVLGIADRETCTARYRHINAFEKLLHDEGTRVVKLFLNISKDEQRERLQKRLDNPKKHWKFDRSDVAHRIRWDDFQAAYQDAIDNTHTDHAPWHMIPADDKRVRDALAGRIVAGVLQAMHPQYPQPVGLPKRIS